MNQEEILDRQIENYIHQRMDDTERKAFEHSLIANPELKKQVFDLLAMKTLYNKELFELKTRLDLAAEKLNDENFFDEGRKS